MIVFNEELHTYTNTETNEKYRSVTTVLGDYTHEFESDFHAERIAKREGVTKEFILEMWEAETKKATDKGTKIHKMMEDYIKNGTIGDYTSPEFYESYNTIVAEHVIKYKTILSEQLLYSHEYNIAGTADLIFEGPKSFTVGDFKTNKKFRFRTDFNDYLKDPISHLAHCEFNSYALQLSLYAYMYECISGKICSNLVIFYLQNSQWIPYNVNYLKSDIINLLNHYKYNNESI
jgi:ATP-dependent exoDNAse (exonuclease V) beta subunit